MDATQLCPQELPGKIWGSPLAYTAGTRNEADIGVKVGASRGQL